MYISNDRNGCSNVNHIAFLRKELFRFRAYCLNYGLGEELFLVESRYALIEVNGGYFGYYLAHEERQRV